ncbi:pilus assembly protein [Sphingomonas lutea]|uniref:Pilus assembly protein n=1 Tax=Sphingomonas lutea TaxID=1045317 RepID=A0A7G9SJ91_9SPHN|nr:TadE/TadG family type IV pilus assembly protein [Sphingomonas lutea]QNN67916.1 pilus assembly protein [Sphingomonas lutea]
MRRLSALLRDQSAAASAEMIFVMPIFIALMYGSMELGNYFLVQHGVTKQVRDGARFASRMPLSDTYSCPGTVFKDAQAETKIINVTKTGSVDGTATGRFPAAFWSTPCTSGGSAVGVSVRCVAKGGYGGVYSGLSGQIPVVKVSANLDYPTLWNSLGFNAGSYCLRANSEVAVFGL